MAVVVRMPSVAAGAEEATVANWLVASGDTVTAGTPLAEIETEKALVEYAAEEPGIVGRLVVPAGETTEIGSPIAVLVAGGETDADIDAALGVTASARAAAPAEPSVPDPPVTVTPQAPDANGHRSGPPRIFASPIARKAARERGIDLASVTGTGPNGRIVRRDLERVASGAVPAPEAPLAPEAPPVPAPGSAPAVSVAAAPAAARPLPAGDTLIPHTPMRRAIARRLTESKTCVPHFYMTAECAVDELLSLRERVNAGSPAKISVNDFVIMAAAAAFGDVPEANVTWSEEGLIAHSGVDISIAVATEGGLVTPVLRDAGSKKLTEIARSSAGLAARARDRKLRQDEIEGGVFSVSNLGMYGTREFSAIINPPQSGILAVGAAREQPVAADGELRVATVMRCTLSVDHRAIDGALAARWLAAFTQRIEHPLSAIA
ncbi:MAG: 2-oxo acid dehydrogenase subunit E2 [Streptosporangiales bacterium]|nr:2-oxo acid dehydrogenase subunit E2 [Streptosporangiales bacterium]